MKPTSANTSANSQTESTEAPWPRVLKIAGEEFQQSVAVAQLAVRLCELEHARSKIVKQPDEYLLEAWELIQKARAHVMRPATPLEYMAGGDGSHEELAVALGQLSEPNVAFAELCDPDRKGGGTETIEVLDAKTGKRIKVKWKVYRSLLGFEKLFGAYWLSKGEEWKEADRTKKPVPQHSKDHSTIFAALARKEEVWKERGERLLKSWKQHGVPPADFVALARFRPAHDKRAANLPEKPKKRRVAKE